MAGKKIALLKFAFSNYMKKWGLRINLRFWPSREVKSYFFPINITEVISVVFDEFEKICIILISPSEFSVITKTLLVAMKAIKRRTICIQFHRYILPINSVFIFFSEILQKQ